MKFLMIISFIFLLACKEDKKTHSNTLTVDLEYEMRSRNSLIKSMRKTKDWDNRIQEYKRKLKEDIKSRNLNHNIDSLKFVFLKYLDRGAKCDKENKTVMLGANFKESSFIHEIGHCLNTLNYSHYFSYTEDNKKYIMSYSFDDRLLKINRKKILDIFFNKDLHRQLDSSEGDISHKRMILERDFDIRTKDMNEVELSKTYNHKIGLDKFNK